MKLKPLPAGFVIPLNRLRPAVRYRSGCEIKHDGYRLIVHRDGALGGSTSATTGPCGRRPLPAAELIKAKSFTIDGEAIAVGPDGLSRFEGLPDREVARTATLSAFDEIEHGGEDLRNLPFPDRKPPLAWLMRGTQAGASCFTRLKRHQ